MIIEIKVEGKRGRREGEIFFLIEKKKKKGRTTTTGEENRSNDYRDEVEIN